MTLPVLALVALLILGALLLTNTAFRRKQITREWSELVEGADRYVDVGVLLRVVVADPNGTELLEGKPKLRVIREHRFGGMLDTKAVKPFICGPSQNPRVWLCSEDQEAIVLHPDDAPLGQLVYGSEGAGKTSALVIWTYLRWIEHLGERREGGITAPTEVRVGLVLREFFLQFRSAWFKFQSSTNIMTLCDGTRLRLVSTYQQSAAQGSRIQGFNWSWCARDEGQDQVDCHSDIESRGRSSRVLNGVLMYKQLITATAKDDPEWRTLRDKLDAAKKKDGSPLWIRRTLYGRRSPFIDVSFWDDKMATMSPREYARRVEAKDVGPERATYPTWSRETNMIDVPLDSMGILNPARWKDVTALELRASGQDYHLLVGHDPGTIVDVSLMLRAYVLAPNYAAYAKGTARPFWVVHGEVNTSGTTENHIAKLLETVRDRWRLNLLDSKGRATGPQMLVRGDPAGDSDNRTEKSVYTQFSNAQIRIQAAAYSKADPSNHGRVPKNPGIELVNTLLLSESKERRLFVARNPDGSPAAPKLVAALESSERNTDGKAEAQRKDANDVSHWPAALRYSLWAIERPRLKLLSREDS